MPENALRMSPLRPRQVRALEMMADGIAPVRIAAECRVNIKTLWRWKARDPAFMAALEEARTARDEAWKAINDVVKGGKASMARFKAACLVLGLTESDLRGDPDVSKSDGPAHKRLLAKQFGGANDRMKAGGYYWRPGAAARGDRDDQAAAAQDEGQMDTEDDVREFEGSESEFESE